MLTPDAPQNDQGPDSDPESIYVGYLPLPKSHRRLLRIIVPLTLWILAGVAVTVAVAQRSPGKATWTFLTPDVQPQQWTGTLIVDPYPMLLRDGENGLAPMLIVEEGKKSARPRLLAHDHKRVQLTGWRLKRDNREMIELLAKVPDGGSAIEVVDSATQAVPGFEALGPFAASGEIMDSKCFLGAMKPAFGASHRACALLCISNGIPPMLFTTRDDGTEGQYLLIDENHEPINQKVLEHIGRPVRISGVRMQLGDLSIIRVDAGGIEPLR